MNAQTSTRSNVIRIDKKRTERAETLRRKQVRQMKRYPLQAA